MWGVSEKEAGEFLGQVLESPDVCISSWESGGLLCSPLYKIQHSGVVVCRSGRILNRLSGPTFFYLPFPSFPVNWTLEGGSKLSKFTDFLTDGIRTRAASLLPPGLVIFLFLPYLATFRKGTKLLLQALRPEILSKLKSQRSYIVPTTLSVPQVALKGGQALCIGTCTGSYKLPLLFLVYSTFLLTIIWVHF